jgi:hypothetical protein
MKPRTPRSGLVTRCATSGMLLVVLSLVGCASRWAAPAGTERSTPNPPTSAAPADPPAATRPAALTEFEARHREIANSAGQNGRWAEVIRSLDVLQALRPEDSSLPARRLAAEEAAQALASERLRQAKLAQQRGDADVAQRHYLDVLALQPAASAADATQAADGLRTLERERVGRQHLGVPARSTFLRAPLAAARNNGKAGTSGRNDVEHASMLAAQGDVGGAISLLKPVAATGSMDAGTRRLLGDLYLRQADALWPQQRTAAITAAENGLQADPSNKTLRERLAKWKDAPAVAKAAAPATAPAPVQVQTPATGVARRQAAKPAISASNATGNPSKAATSVTR